MEKIRQFLGLHQKTIKLLKLIIGGILVALVTNNFFEAIAPFVIAYVVMHILRPLILWIKRKTKLPHILCVLTCFLFFIAILGGLLALCVYYIADGITNLINTISEIATVENITILAKYINETFDHISEFLRIDLNVSDIVGVVGDLAKNIITSLSNISISFAMQVPSMIVAFIICCVASFYMLADYDKIVMAIKKLMPPSTISLLKTINNRVVPSMFKMIWSYALLSVVCFVELIIGLSILKVEQAALVALLIAVLDVLPILGSGAVLLPWGIISLITGHPFIGIGLIILWGVIVVVRQILEPKIVGVQIGLHPLVTIIAMYMGTKLMGGLGLIIGPFYTIIAKELLEAEEEDEIKKVQDNK